MNELDILFPAPVMLLAGGEQIPVAPLKVRQFAAMMRAMQPVMGAFRVDSKEVDIAALLDSPDALQIVALGIGRGTQFVSLLGRNQQLNALLLVLGANPDFFFPDAPAAEDDDAENAKSVAGMADVFQRLVSAGHAWSEIQDYTLAQVRLFGATADRLAREGDRTALLTARAAWADAPVFKGLFEALGGKA
jgi:hypothetical protein